MKFIKREFHISFVNAEDVYRKIYGEIDEVFCDKKTFHNRFMMILFSIAAIISAAVPSVLSGSGLSAREYLLSLFGLLPFGACAAYFGLGIANFKLFINDKEVRYTDLFGREFNYSIYEIADVKYNPSMGTDDGEDSLRIKLTDNKSIRLTSNDRNFDRLKYFCISRKLM